jgi:hypothetical protein
VDEGHASPPTAHRPSRGVHRGVRAGPVGTPRRVLSASRSPRARCSAGAIASAPVVSRSERKPRQGRGRPRRHSSPTSFSPAPRGEEHREQAPLRGGARAREDLGHVRLVGAQPDLVALDEHLRRLVGGDRGQHQRLHR